MTEEWKQYKGTYYASNTGKIKKINWHNSGKEKELKLNDVAGGYLQFTYYEDGIRKQAYTSIAVWEAFNGTKPEGYDIHHINHNRTDNRLENLCLVDSSLHKTMHNKENYHKSKENLDRSEPVLQFSKEGVFISEYPSAAEAERQTNIDHSNIIKCCLNKRKSAGDYIWRFSKEYRNIESDINFTGAMSLCGITITEETVEVDD